MLKRGSLLNKSAMHERFDENLQSPIRDPMTQGARRSNLKRHMITLLQDKPWFDLTAKELIHEIDTSVKKGEPVSFKNFGLRDSAIIQLYEEEKL